MDMLPIPIMQHFRRLCAATPEVSQLILFGSRAQGTHRYNSDIDVAVDWLVRPPASFYLDLDEAAGIYHIDIVDLPYTDDNPLLQKEIRQHGITLFERE